MKQFFVTVNLNPVSIVDSVPKRKAQILVAINAQLITKKYIVVFYRLVDPDPAFREGLDPNPV